MARSSLKRTALFFGCATSLFACAGVLSLDDFSKGECPGARCGDGAPPDDVTTIDGPDGSHGEGGVDGGSDAQGSDPTTWAKWPMPNYKTLEGGAGPGVAMNLEQGGAPDEIHDIVTDLVWKKTALSEAKLADARIVCDQIQDPSKAKWRLPKRIELVTLLDYGQPSAPYIHKGQGAAEFDPLFTQAPIWTSSEVLDPTLQGNVKSTTPRKYWAVNFGTGELVAADGNTGLRVLCVKGL